jgi:hypothetical protein
MGSISEEDVEAFLTKLKLSDNDKKVDQIQLFGLKLEPVGEVCPETAIRLIL